MHVGQRVEIHIANSRGSAWLDGTVQAVCASPYVEDDFERIDVLTDDGRTFLLCHPASVRVIVSEAA